MMQPYMGVYGITKILLEQPCNLELQIYWETHGFLRLESKQWGSTSFERDKKSTAFTYPIAFPKEFISAVAADTGGGAQGFGVTPLDNQHANIFRSGSGYAGSGRLIIIGR